MPVSKKAAEAYMSSLDDSLWRKLVSWEESCSMNLKYNLFWNEHSSPRTKSFANH